jgi:serine/threonine-protein kinase
MPPNGSDGDSASEPMLAGRYRIGDLLGRGGMGEVRTGYDVKLRRRVAIKLLARSAKGETSAQASASKTRIVRLLREARAVASLSHPNVVAIYDVGEDERTPFIVMELLEGGSLAGRMGAGKHPTMDQALSWLEEIAGALASAHRAGIVHRDIKPDNILIDRDGHAKIADFGIVKGLETPVPDAATVSSTAEELTGLGRMVGTPRYMAPEQLRGELVDGRTDEFAFGLLAFELLAAKHPYDATTAVTTPQVVANGCFVVPRLSERVPNLPAGVDELVARCLAPEPADRVPSMSEVRDAFVGMRRSLASSTTTTSTATARTQTTSAEAPRPSRFPVKLTIAVIAALAVVAAVAAGLLLRQRSELAHTSIEAHPLVGLGDKCLDGSAGPLELRTCDGTSAQAWHFDDGRLVAADGRCVGAQGESAKNTTPLELQRCGSQASQAWQLRAGHLVAGSIGKCANVAHNRTQDGTPIILFDCDNRPNEHWRPGSP